MSTTFSVFLFLSLLDGGGYLTHQGDNQGIIEVFSQAHDESTLSGAAFVSNDGKWLAVSAGGKLSLWDIREKRRVISLGDQRSSYSAVGFVGSDRLLVSCSKSGTPDQFAGTLVTSVPDLKTLEQYPGRYILARSPGGVLCVCQTFDPEKGIQAKWPPDYESWDLKTGKSLFPIAMKKHTQIDRVTFRADGAQFILETAMVGPALRPKGVPFVEPTAILIESKTGKDITTLETRGGRCALSSDGKTIAVAAGWEFRDRVKRRDALWFMDVETGRASNPVGAVLTDRGVVLAAHYLPGGKHLVLVTSSGASLLDLATEKPTKPVGDAKLLEGNTNTSFTLETDGHTYVTAWSQTGVQVWKVPVPAKKP